MKLNALPDLAKSVAENLSNTFSEWISKRFPALNYLPRNVELKKVNGIFKSKNLFKNKQIYVGVEWADGVCSSLPIEMANLLAPGRTFSGKDILDEVGYETVTACITGLVKIDKSSAHYRYIYQTDKGLISVSGFELARTLFFHHRHLVNAAYTANGLSELALVDRTTSPVSIRFPASTSYPVSYLNTRKSRAHFAWLFLDNEARRSLFSIYQSFKKNSSSIAFNFSPPKLEGWILEVSIINNPHINRLEVQRIEAIVDAHISESFFGVEIHHPKRKFQVESADIEKGKHGRTPNVDIDPELDMGNIPAFGQRLHTQKAGRFSFNVSQIKGIVFSDGKESSKSACIPVVNQDVAPEQAGLGPPERGGEGQEFDPVINQDDDGFEEAKERPQKFLMFAQIMEELGQSKAITLESIKCCVFPNPTNNNRAIFQTKDQKTLRFFVAILDIEQIKIVILEADTTSLIKSKGASTLLLGLKEDATNNLNEIIQSFSNHGATWRKNDIQVRTNRFLFCKHPWLQGKGKVLSEDEYKSKWIHNLRGKLDKLLKSDK